MVADPTKEAKVANAEPVYVPRDEKFEPLKLSNFSANQLRGLVHMVIPSLRDYIRGDSTRNEFDSFRDMDTLYQEGIDTTDEPSWAGAARDYGRGQLLTGLQAGESEDPRVTKQKKLDLENLPIPDFLKKLIQPNPKNLLRFPLPRILCRDRFAWMRDDEFARQTLAGVNPVVIRCLEVRETFCSMSSNSYQFDFGFRVDMMLFNR